MFDFGGMIGNMFSNIGSSILNSVTNSIMGAIQGVIGQAIGKVTSGIGNSISKALGGGQIGNIFGSAIGNAVGGTLYGVAGNVMGQISGTLNNTFSQVFTATSKQAGISGVGYNVSSLSQSVYNTAQMSFSQNLSNNLSKAGHSIGTAVGSSLGASISAGFNSRFVDFRSGSYGFTPPVPVDIIASATARTFNNNSLSYPSEFLINFIQMDFAQYVAPSTYSSGFQMTKQLGSVTLPLPANLTEAYDVQYNDVALGMFGGEFADVAKGLANITPGNNFAGAQNIGAQVRERLANADTIYALSRRAVGTVSEGLGTIFDQVTGKTPNPHLSVAFQGIGFRSHNFSWRLSPNSKEESDRIKEIIAFLKARMLPQRDGFFLRYPDVVKPTLVIGNSANPYFFAFKPCVIDQMSVNYAPSGQPSFVRDQNNMLAPMEVEITLVLKEIEIWTTEPGDKRYVARG